MFLEPTTDSSIKAGVWAGSMKVWVVSNEHNYTAKSRNYTRFCGFDSRLAIAILLLTFIVCFKPAGTSAESLASVQARYSLRPEIKTTTVSLRGGSSATLVSEVRTSGLTAELMDNLRITHSHYHALFGEIPAVRAKIRIMEEPDFFAYTKAPQWTNAMYFRGEILLPINSGQPIDRDNLNRALRHEYSHAVISALSAGKARGWFDEGIAQWAEGVENPNLKIALKSWVSQNGPVALSLLQNGFTRLSTEMVPAAYAQSLLASRVVMNSFGLERVANYFKLLRSGHSNEAAFDDSFGVSEQEFEKLLNTRLLKWSIQNHTTSLESTAY